MPAGGDNKPKIEKSSGSTSSTPKQYFIRERITISFKISNKSHIFDSLLTALAITLFITSFVAGCFLAIQPGVSFAILIPDLLLFVSSIYYLSRKI